MDDLTGRIRESRPTTGSMSVDVHDLVQRARRRDVAGRVVLGVALLAATGVAGVALATTLGGPADEVRLAPPAPTAPASPTAPNTPAVPTAVPQASESSTACGPHAVAADLDGDGAADAVENVWEEEKGATTLRICMGTGERWEIEVLWGGEFLEVADVEEDGRAEIFFGGTTVSMRIAELVVWEEGTPRIVVDGAGVPLEVRSGYELPDWWPPVGWGCEDKTGDGTRELVTVEADEEAGDGRWLITGYRLEGSTAVEISREEMGGADPPPVAPCTEAPASPSEPSFTELPEPTVPERPVPEASESSTACGPQALAADIDGDGAADAVEHVYEERTVLRICMGTGGRWEIEGLWGAEVLYVADIEEDGRAEIFYGGTSVIMAGAQIVVWEEGTPRVVVDGAGVPLVVESGWEQPTDGGLWGPPPADWGCEDRTGDGTRELVTVGADEEGGEGRWLVTGYRLEGSTAVEVSSEEVAGADPPPVTPCVEPGP